MEGLDLGLQEAVGGVVIALVSLALGWIAKGRIAITKGAESASDALNKKLDELEAWVKGIGEKVGAGKPKSDE